MDAIHRVFDIFASVQANDLTAQVADDLVHLTVLVNKSASAEAFHLAAERDLSISQMRLIFHLDGAERPPALHELAELIGLSVAATGRAVDGLVRAGLVTRTEDPDDRRVKLLANTPAGHELLERFTASKRAGATRLVEALTDDERERLSATLAPLLERLEQTFAHPTAAPAPTEGATR